MSTMELDARDLDQNRAEKPQESPTQKLRNLFDQLRRSVVGDRGEAAVAQQAQEGDKLPRISQEAYRRLSPVLSKIDSAILMVDLYEAIGVPRYAIDLRNDDLVASKVDPFIEKSFPDGDPIAGEKEVLKKYLMTLFEEKRVQIKSGVKPTQAERDTRMIDQSFGDKIDAVSTMSDYKELENIQDEFFNKNPQINRNELTPEQVTQILDQVKQKAIERMRALQDMVKDHVRDEISAITSPSGLLAYGGLDGYAVGTKMKDPSPSDQSIQNALADKLVASGRQYNMNDEITRPMAKDVMSDYMKRYKQIKNS